MNLEERVLENVFRQAGIAKITGQVAVELALVPVDQFGEDVGAPFLAVPAHQLLIGELAEVFRRIRSYGLNHLTYRRGRRFRRSVPRPAPPYARPASGPARLAGGPVRRATISLKRSSGE